MMKQGWLVLPCAVLACGKADDKAKPATDKPGSPTVAKPSTDTAFDGGRYCDAVFGAADVGRILGVDGLADPTRAERPKPPKGMATCELQAPGPDRTKNGASATLLLDCRGVSQNPEQMKKMYENMEGFREVPDLGKRAFYASPMPNLHTRQITFFTETPACSSTVSTSFHEPDQVLELAKHVLAKLPEQPAP